MNTPADARRDHLKKDFLELRSETSYGARGIALIFTKILYHGKADLTARK